jgi:hypothetical protein
MSVFDYDVLSDAKDTDRLAGLDYVLTVLSRLGIVALVASCGALLLL